MDKLRNILACIVRISFGVMLIPLLAHAAAEASDEALRLEAALLKRDLVVYESRSEASADLILNFGQDAATDPDGRTVGTPGVRIDSIRLLVDDRELLSRAYTDKEADALRRGGVDSLTATGIGSGSHRLKVVVQAHDSEGGTFVRKGRIEFTRDDTPARVQVFFTSQPDTPLRMTLME